MWVKAYIKHKSSELVTCNLLFKHGKIQEVEMEFFKGITPFENNSELADNIEILRTYKQDSSNKFCKYFIKKSINKEVHITYLDISWFEYFKLQWQLKKYLIQSKDLKMEVLKYVTIGLIGFFAAMIYQKYKSGNQAEEKQKEPTKIEVKKPNG
ncbi:hypothetical protein [Flavobacterium capsici]|uniref:Uncharacterized protein n=1 Tax=Flavobacterium capsici TaxID=3075618 RepID=A0AA96J335_9FLAO|nr:MULTISPECIES: hypothetical protein [unclassified Flavobacterium]WNM18868.1 hypothetical protein RN608_12750 [Flavobacterium sp. PMR2A8]WNM22918.1 hypothetical protein RN605_06050 [Flavobacterium sp. PMTSA4]